MDIKELDRRAKQGLELPSTLAGYEQAYYIASRGLYEQYKRQEITIEQARREKEKVIQFYHQGQGEFRYLMRLHELWGMLTQLKSDGFNSVIEFEILDLLNETL